MRIAARNASSSDGKANRYPAVSSCVGTTRWLLTTHGLYRADDANDRFTRVADAPTGDPFGSFDTFCSAPLTVFAGRLWAGSTRDGRVFSIRAR